MTQRDKYKARIAAAKEELKTAGPIHRRDLSRQISNMQKELKTYDRYQRLAGQAYKVRTKTD